MRRTDRPSASAELALGWNGLHWGSPLAEFRARFPHAARTESGWWVTGEGAEEFCGIPMAFTQYGFDQRDQLYMVSFIPEVIHRDRLAPAALNALGAPSDYATVWRLGDVVVEVKIAGVVATVTHGRYA
ncbi:hypothetical protein [Paractinoplanes lichenicola]|uniref:Uncharacterized protein n=1 Tax=Paractinoplanes lichenicola TaxID=2802976 RepID=A0ABS1VUD2_9ACTN|nr:hypothetical protein [Actinoplanes lichenicola]MBL7258097.1 hypothetical protein [Actinoplanes lichenicola]